MPKINPIICYLEEPKKDSFLSKSRSQSYLKDFYKKNLKQFRILRYLLPICYEIALSFRKEMYFYASSVLLKFSLWYPQLKKNSLILGFNYKSFKLITHGDAERKGLISISVNSNIESVVKLKKVDIHPKAMAYYINENNTPKRFPPVNLYNVNNATVYGGSSITYLNGDKPYAIIHDLYDYKRDLLYEESRNYLAINNFGNAIIFLSPSNFKLESAVSFLDAASGNYAHWITEVLPKIYLYIVKQNLNVPMLVDRDVHPNIIDFIRTIAKPTNQIFAVKGGEGVSVNSLYFFSAVGYASLDPRKIKASDHPEGFFCSEILYEMSSYLRTLANPIGHCRKIFVKRSSSTRSIINIDQVEKLLLLNGYEVVYLERMSILSQIKTISEASHIVGQAGAACANFIFCQPNTKIVIMAGASKDGGFNYWENILGFANLNVTLLLGISVGVTTSHHTDFIVAIDQLEALI